jgi:predicted transposase/invertase (TIGR01784 family)
MNAKTVEDMRSIAVRNPDIMEAFKIVQEVMGDPDAWRLYEAQQDQIRIQETEEAIAREEGIEIGEKRGEKKGIIESAKKLIANEMDPKTICEMLGISESDLT